MKILLVSLFLPEQKAYHAGSRYVAEILKQLSRKYEIHLVTRLDKKELSNLDELRPFCEKIYPFTYRSIRTRGILDSVEILINYFAFSRYANTIARNGHFDVIQVEWVEAALAIKKGSAPMILEAHDVITKPAARSFQAARGLMRIIGWFRFVIVKALERRLVQRFDRVFTRSEYDKNYLLSIEPSLKVSVVPHPAGLDITDRSAARQKKTLLFLGSFRYRRVNVDAALYFYREVLPLIRKIVPDVKFIIAGYGPPGELTALQKSDPSVMVTGFVDDIDKCYKEAEIFVAPILTGGGIIVKILDAMAAGTPVVTTSYGNEGIGAVSGRDLLVADDTESFAKAVVRLMTEPSFALRIAESGRRFVHEHYSLDLVMNRIESCYSEIVRNGKK